jgi:hypothetical protein
VSALYGGGSISYNFLHLTIQEFFAAYHISHLGSSGLQVFKHYSKLERYNVVWRFVAGLTQFRWYEGHIDRNIFVNEKSEELEFSVYFYQCLFEAQSEKYLSSTLETPSSTTAYIRLFNPVALDAYAVGYCIANFPIGVFWDVEFSDEYYDGHYSFICGLNTNVPSAGVINRLHMHGNVVISDLKSNHLIGTTSLEFSGYLSNANMVHLSELIPHLTSLKKLYITHIEITGEERVGGWLNVLRNSNVTSLDIGLDQYSRDYISALRCLIHPSSGKLEHLGVGYMSRKTTDEDTLVDLLSAPSSLKSLHLATESISSHAVYLKSNANLTTLKLASEIPEDQIPALIDIVNCNTTLKVLVLKQFYFSADSKGWINPLRSLVSALHNNNTLQRIDFYVSVYDSSDDVTRRSLYCDSDSVTHFLACHEGLTFDSRVTWAPR